MEEEPDNEPPAADPGEVAGLLARQATKEARSAFRNIFGGLRR